MVSANEAAHDEVYLQHRERLFGIAYRMLGTVVEAEDVLQDAWIRWRQRDGASVVNAGAYLTRIVTNLSIDALRRLQPAREQYPGPWLPQPIIDEVAGEHDDTEAVTELAKSLSVALLTMLETVPPNERAVFVLREAFDMSFAEIGECIQAKPATCRQWFKRAGDRLGGVDWDNATAGVEGKLLERFVGAMAAGDFDALVALLHPEVVLVSDGGGNVAAATRPLHGAREVSRFLNGIVSRVIQRVSVRRVRVNGDWGGLLFIDDKLDCIYSIKARDEHIAGIYLLRNPEKLLSLTESIKTASS